MDTFLVIAGVLVAIIAAVLVAGRPLLNWLRKKEARQAYEQFRVQR